MNNQYIQYPLKRSLKPLAWAREYFSISIYVYGREHQQRFYNVLVLHKLYEPRVTQEHDVSKTTYSAGRSSSRFPPKLPLEPAEMSMEKYQAFSSLNNCLGKLVQIAIIKRLSVRWRQSGVTLQLRDKGFSLQKEVWRRQSANRHLKQHTFSLTTATWRPIRNWG